MILQVASVIGLHRHHVVHIHGYVCRARLIQMCSCAVGEECPLTISGRGLSAGVCHHPCLVVGHILIGLQERIGRCENTRVRTIVCVDNGLELTRTTLRCPGYPAPTPGCPTTDDVRSVACDGSTGSPPFYRGIWKGGLLIWNDGR